MITFTSLVETDGSFWLFDRVSRYYMRHVKNEAWADHPPGQDRVWAMSRNDTYFGHFWTVVFSERIDEPWLQCPKNWG